MWSSVFKQKITRYHIVLFLISGMVVFNIYIGIKINYLIDRTQYYNTQIKPLKEENKNLTLTWGNLKKSHLSNIYQTDYINLQSDYLESKLNSRVNFDFYLSQIRSITPSSVQLNQITFKNEAIQIQAVAGNYSDIGYYIKELENSNLFTKVDYNFEPNDNIVGNYIARTINCNINLKF